MADPSIAVVIPTYGRETRLRFALEALAAQTLQTKTFEVIVVRAPDATGPYATAPDGLNVRFEVSERRGAASQRNHGWRVASAPLVAFTDDDCRPAPAWLERLLAHADGESIVQGRTEPDPDELHLLYGFARTMEVAKPGLAESCNIAYPRPLLERLGGFAEELFPDPWAEDTDLGLRASAAGAATHFADEALVFHAVLQPSFTQVLREARRHRWQPLLIRRHPELRRGLVAGVFANRAHALLAAGVVGAAVLPRRRRWVATLPYVAECVRAEVDAEGVSPRRLARLAAHLPLRAGRDLVEFASTVEGAARNQTLVI